MALAPGTRLGPYEVTAQIGVGGMGEVYKATDTRLDRTVAIKVLHEHVASDSELKLRFEREAKTLAALSHPHICPVYDVGSQDGIDFLVMEHLEGETLAQRLSKGALPLDQALQVAIQIADALDKAHRKGIVHRDLKPGNIMLTKGGVGSAGSPQAKLLDFGLAKLRPTSVVGGVALSEAATVSRPFGAAQGEPLTGAGSILGTFQYMAPEQLEGQEADARTDIFAFGAVLYEVLTGKRAFEGKSQASLIAAILERDPAPVSSLQPVSPPTLDRVVKKCLAKSADQRWQSAKDLHDELEWIATAGFDAGTGAPVAAPRRVAGWKLGLALSGVFCAGLAVAGAMNWVAMRDEPPTVTRVEVTTPAEATLSLDIAQRNIAITPDGSRIIYRGRDGAGNFALFVRALAQLSPTVLTVANARAPFVSPDGQWVGFFTTGGLWKVAMTGGPAVSVVGLDAGRVRGATWGEDGTIIFATGNRETGLQRVSADGGTVEVLTRPDATKGEEDHVWPELLPGGQAVLFTIWPPSGGSDNAQVAVLDLRSGTQRVLVRGGIDARYVSSGNLVFGAGGGLRSVPFDLQRLTVTGTPVQVVEGVATSANGSAEYAISSNGNLIYVAAGTARRELVWVDRQGNEEALGATPRAYTRARISPDGSRVALEVRAEAEEDLWVWDVEQRRLSRVTFDPETDSDPVWTPDGHRLIFTSGADRSSTSRSVYAIQADGGGVASLLLRAGAVGKYPETVARDGSRVIYVELASTGDWDLMEFLLPPEGAALPSSPPALAVLLKSAFNEINARLSPTNQWMVYQSDESGRYETYVRPYPNVQAGRFQISTEGARLARWSKDGRELFYVSLDNILMAVRVEPGPAWRASPPARVISMESYLTGPNTDFDVSSDGQRFLVIKEEAGSALVARNLVVVQNFTEDLKRLVPAK